MRLMARGLLLCLFFGGGQSLGQSFEGKTAGGTVVERLEMLNLLVTLNGRDTGMVAEFQRDVQTGTLTATVADLNALGLWVSSAGRASIPLNAIAGLESRYDGPSQTLFITAPATALAKNLISARAVGPIAQGQPGWGVVLNYQANANLGHDLMRDGPIAKSLRVALDLRASSPIGVLKITGSASQQPSFDKVLWSREDTSFVHVAQNQMVILTLGDFVSAGLSGARPIRIGGVQIRRDFSANQGFGTNPSLSYSGVAVLPSALDVYINNVRAWSGTIDAGPFTLSDVPTVSAQGDAIFVLRDPSGVEKTTSVSFFKTQNLLRAGVADYTIQGGHPRQNYAQMDLSYGAPIIGLGSVRYGLSDRLTLSGQIESTQGLMMLGGGVDTALFGKAELGIYTAQSRSLRGQGAVAVMSLRTKVGAFDLRASHRATFGQFQDLAAYLAADQSDPINATGRYVPAQLEQALSLSIPMNGVDGTAGLSLFRSKRETQTVSILSASISVPFGKGAFRMNGFADLSGTQNFGMSVGLSLPLGKSRFGDVKLARTPRGTQAQFGVARQAGRNPGDRGYALTLSGQNGAMHGTATMTRQGRFARSFMTLRSQPSRVTADINVTGSVVVAGGSAFLANHIQDGYAIVDVGVPRVAVNLNNRPIAVTGPHGRALLSDLRSYQSNRISINPLELPPNTSISVSAMDVVPMKESGVAVSFGGSVDSSALVVLRAPTGAFLPVGTPILLSATGEIFPMGYDGQVWIEGLNQKNTVTAVVGPRECSAQFDFIPDPMAQVYIDGVVCK